MKHFSHSPISWVGCCLAACMYFAGPSWNLASAQDLVPNLKSRDAVERLSGAHAAIEEGGPGLPKILRKLLKDKDWEVAMLATSALGDVGEAKDVGSLVKLASGAPIAQWRATAALALGKLDAPLAVKGLIKKLKKETTGPACEALILIAPQVESFEPPKALSRLLKDDSATLRASGAGALLALTRSEREPLLKSLLASEFLSVRARVLEVAQTQPNKAYLNPIGQLLKRPLLNDVILRRALPAFVACANLLEGETGSTYEALIVDLAKSKTPEVARRAALLAEELLDAEYELLNWTAKARDHKDSGVRAGAARLLGLLKDEAALEVCLAFYDKDGSERVRLAALGSILRLQPITEEAGRVWAVAQLPTAREPSLRELIAVALGDKSLLEDVAVAKALVVAMDDPDWAVAACAAVSLGITRNPLGVSTLLERAIADKDWRLRGAAVVGLTKALQKEGIPGLIIALQDTEPLIRRTALSYLNTLRRGDKLTAESKEWTPWWESIKGNIRLYDPREQRERNAKYGYTASPEVIYRDLDVLVLNSRGDHIQKIFERLEIDHRMTQSEHIPDDGLDAGGVFVSNCTGEMGRKDLERLQWFVKVGGYLTGSCWALTETIQHLEPGIVRMLGTNEQVMDDVIASPCDIDSQYTQGVFAPYVKPIYHLEGAHLIEVRQPERIQMLVDSVGCAERWGGGNLACWFQSGHGTILDSANHFDSPVFQHAKSLKKPEQRMAYAIDHMGATFQRIRETVKEKFWSSNSKAAEHIFDDSVFRLLTNFVRLRRLEGR
jgi:HEAT repeat protein